MSQQRKRPHCDFSRAACWDQQLHVPPAPVEPNGSMFGVFGEEMFQSVSTYIYMYMCIYIYIYIMFIYLSIYLSI